AIALLPHEPRPDRRGRQPQEPRDVRERIRRLLKEEFASCSSVPGHPFLSDLPAPAHPSLLDGIESTSAEGYRAGAPSNSRGDWRSPRGPSNSRSRPLARAQPRGAAHLASARFLHTASSPRRFVPAARRSSFGSRSAPELRKAEVVEDLVDAFGDAA